MRKQIALFTCTLMLLCGCTAGTGDLQSDLNARMAKVNGESAHRPVYSKDFYSYYVQPDIGRIRSDQVSSVFMKDGTKFVMNLNVPQIVNDRYYDAQAAGDEVAVNAVLQAESQGTYLDYTDKEHPFDLRIYQLNDQYYAWLQTDTAEFYSVCGQLQALQMGEEFLRIARTVRVDEKEVVSAYSKQTTISYTRKKLQLFQNIAPESGSVQELFESNHYAGTSQDPFGDNYGQANTTDNGTITSDEAIQDGDTQVSGQTTPLPGADSDEETESKQS